MYSIDSPLNLVYGAATGLVFGFLLQRGGLTRYRTIVGQFLLADHTMLKTMLTAVVVGGAGVYAMHLNPEVFGDVKLHVRSAALVANAVGGLIFGVAMVLLGYCPGTGAAALGDGSRHAVFGALGMVVGGALYAELYPWVGAPLDAVCDVGKKTLPGMLGLHPGIVLAALAGVAVVLFALIEWSERGGANPQEPSAGQ